MLAEMNQSFGGMDITVTPMMMAMAVPIALAVEFIKAIIGRWKIITPEVKKPLFPLLGIGLAVLSFWVAGIESWLMSGMLIGLSAGGGYDLFKGMANVRNGKPVTNKPMVLLLCFLLLAAGCMWAENPRADLLASQKVFAATVDSLTALQQAGKFSAEETEQIGIFVNLGGSLLNQWAIAIKSDIQQPEIIQSFQVVLNKLIEYQIQKGGAL